MSRKIVNLRRFYLCHLSQHYVKMSHRIPKIPTKMETTPTHRTHFPVNSSIDVEANFLMTRRAQTVNAQPFKSHSTPCSQSAISRVTPKTMTSLIASASEVSEYPTAAATKTVLIYKERVMGAMFRTTKIHNKTATFSNMEGSHWIHAH